MPNSELLTQIPAQDWEATPPSVRQLLLALLPLAAEVNALRGRLDHLEGQANRPAEESVESAETTGCAQEHRARVRRYHALVDQLFLNGLSAEEEAAMQQLGAEIDAYNAPFYAPIMERLQTVTAGRTK